MRDARHLGGSGGIFCILDLLRSFLVQSSFNHVDPQLYYALVYQVSSPAGRIPIFFKCFFFWAPNIGPAAAAPAAPAPTALDMLQKKVFFRLFKTHQY